MTEEPPSLEELYEPDVLARIDAVLADVELPDEPDEADQLPADRGPVSVNGRMAEWAQYSAVGGMLRGVGKAVEDLLRNEIEIVQEVEDRSEAAEDDRPVRLVLVPDAPKQSKAFVRPWLFARRRERLAALDAVDVDRPVDGPSRSADTTGQPD